MEGDSRLTNVKVWMAISIHTLRVEGDYRLTGSKIACIISIHTLRVEGDEIGINEVPDLVKFQSTPSVWRVTLCWLVWPPC